MTEPLEPGTIIFRKDIRGIVLEPVVCLNDEWKYQAVWNLPDLTSNPDPTEPEIWEHAYAMRSEFRIATDDEEREIMRRAAGGSDNFYPGAYIRVTGSNRSLKRYRKWSKGKRGRLLYYIGSFPFGDGERWQASIECDTGRYGRRSIDLAEHDMTLISPLELLALEA